MCDCEEKMSIRVSVTIELSINQYWNALDLCNYINLLWDQNHIYSC